MTQTKIERLKAIKEQFDKTKAALDTARRLEESAEANSLSTLLENNLDQAELILAAQDMMHKLQNMAEDLAKMNAQDLFPLVDKMKATFGQEGAHAFESSAQEALSGAMNTVRRAKDEMGNSIMRLEGKVPANDMAAGSTMDPGADMTADPAAGAPTADAGAGAVDMAMDDFGGADAAAGPENEPLGRARKESIETTKSSLSESVILETAGRKLLETEGLKNLITWVLSEAAAGMPEEHFRSFATSIATKAATDPARLAGWIGKKRNGMAAMAQLAEPTYTQETAPELELAEGKSFKNSDDDDDNWKKKSNDKARQQNRSKKNDQVDEGKTFKNNDDDDDNWKKKSNDKARQQNRGKKNDQVDEGKSFKHSDDDDDNWKKKSNDKSRQQNRSAKNDKVDETALAVRAVASLIENSIKREGKGNAAKAVKEAAAYLAGKNLVESDQDVEALVLEAFSDQFGMKPAAYSVSKLREFMAPMNPTDKKNAGAAMTKVAGKMGTNPSAAKQSVQSAMTGMTGQERSAATKMLNTMRQNGETPKNAGEFAQKAAGLVDGEETNEEVMENINAAHWPTDVHGQYKGEPMSTDYEKLKPLKTPKAGATETTGGDASPEPKSEEVTDSEPKAPKEPKAEKPSGKPWEKKEETSEEDYSQK